MKNKDSIANLSIRLVIITLCAGLILGLVYAITKDPIAEQVARMENEARMEALPQAADFEQVDLSAYTADETITQVYEGMADGQPVGYTIAMVTKGYSPNLTLTVGIDTVGAITGVTINSHEETPGLGANATSPDFLGQYVGSSGPLTVVKTPTGQTGEIQALTGATITSQSVTDAVNVARTFFEENLKEGV